MSTKVELLVGASWVDITEEAQVVDSPYTITEGRSDGASGPEPSQLTLNLNSPNGRFFPHNPASPYYGKIGRNTRIRLTEDGQPQFFGEVASWKPRWDETGKIKKVAVQAAGIQRRIGQGSQPAFTSLKSYYIDSHPVTYWALDDSTEAIKGLPIAGTFRGSSFYESSASAVVSTFGDGNLASHLSPTLKLDDCTLPSGGMVGSCIGSDTTPDAYAVEFVYRANPETDGAAPAGLADWLIYLETGDTNLTGFPADDFMLLSFTASTSSVGLQVNGNGSLLTFPAAAGVSWNDGNMHHVRIQGVQNGANADFKMYLDGVLVLTGTGTSYNLKQTRRMTLQYDRTAGKDLLAFGHLIIWENAANIPPIATTSALAFGRAGETVGRRIERLCGEQAVPFVSTGNLDETEAMGLQYEDYFANQLDECEKTDMGLIYEPRDQLAVGYRTRRNLYAQTPAVVLSYAGGELFPPLEPTEDDQTTRNDIFAQRREGGSFNATQETGPLNVQDPEDDPDGVGRYKEEYQTNVQTDARLEGIAHWRRNIGTIDDARYPQVTVNLAAPDVARQPALKTALMTAKVGDRIQIKNAQSVNIYADIDLLILGATKTKNALDHLITFNCVPYAPYDVGVYGTSRYDTAGSELQTGIDTTQNTLSVTATGGTLWSTTASGYDVNVGGERMTVLSCTGASSPQSMVVQRSVNGLVKSHLAGTDVKLWSPARYAL